MGQNFLELHELLKSDLFNFLVRRIIDVTRSVLVFGSFIFKSFYIPEYRRNFSRNFLSLFCDSKKFRNMAGTRAYFAGNTRIFWRECAYFGESVCVFWRERFTQNKNDKNDRWRQPQRNLTPFAFIVTACGLYIHRKSHPFKNTMFYYIQVNC